MAARLADFPACTADGRYYYNALMAPGSNRQLIDIAHEMNEYLEVKNNWQDRSQWPPATARLCPGTWGMESTVSRIGAALVECNAYSTIDDIAAAMHRGWSRCLMFWLATMPWRWQTSRYRAPGGGLTSRNKVGRAQTPFEYLDNYQKEIYYQMATFLKLGYFYRW